MTTIWNNDYARAFFKENGYPEQYNDGLLAYLRDLYNVSGSTLPDLLKRHLKEFGDEFAMGVLAKSGVKVSLVEPATTFINSVPSSSGGGTTTTLTSAGVHGLTAAVSVGASIYISAGTGWTVGLYRITALDLDTTGVAITISVPFSAGFGTPTIALANTIVTLVSIDVPPLLPDSRIEWDVTFTVEPDATAGSEDVRIHFGNQAIQAIALSGTTKTHRWIGGFQNKGATNAQTNLFISGTGNSIGSTTVLPNQYSVDTSTTQQIDLIVIPSAANVVMGISSYRVELFK